MKKVLYVGLLFVPVLLLASGADCGKYLAITGRETDIIPRIFNFVIFAGFIYYLVAGKLKAFLASRQDGIAIQLKEIESKLQQAKKAEKDAQALVKESQTKAKKIISDAKKEAEMLADKILHSNSDDLVLMQKQLQEKMDMESKKSIKETIGVILSENISADDIDLSNKAVVSIVDKKVVA